MRNALVSVVVMMSLAAGQHVSARTASDSGTGEPAAAATGPASKPAATSKPATTSKPAGSAASVPATGPAAATRPVKAPAAATVVRPRNAPVMAYVNGQPIYMDELTDLLVAGQGMPVARQLIAAALVRQEGQKNNITVTAAEIQEEGEQMLAANFPSVSDPAQRQSLLDQLLAQFKLTRRQWEMTMELNVMLRKLVEPRLAITEQDLKDGFEDTYGRKVVVRHIQLPSLAAANDVMKKLKGGADFAVLAQKESTSPYTRSGELPIGSKTAGMPSAFREAALALNKPGEISEPVLVGTTYNIFKLERVIEAQKVKLEDVKAKLAESLRQQRAKEMQQSLLQELIMKAVSEDKVQFVNPVLKSQYEASKAAGGLGDEGR